MGDPCPSKETMSKWHRRPKESASSKRYASGKPIIGYKWRIRGPVDTVKILTVDDLPEDSKLRQPPKKGKR